MSDTSKRVFRGDAEGRCTVDEQPAEAQATAMDEMSFSTHVVSLHATALMYLGEVPGEAGEPAETDRASAQHLIDTLVMLKQKTRGNLTDTEDRLLDSVLYELRMKFVQCG